MLTQLFLHVRTENLLHVLLFVFLQKSDMTDQCGHTLTWARCSKSCSSASAFSWLYFLPSVVFILQLAEESMLWLVTTVQTANWPLNFPVIFNCNLMSHDIHVYTLSLLVNLKLSVWSKRINRVKSFLYTCISREY